MNSNEHEFTTLDDVLNEANARDAAELSKVKAVLAPQIKANTLRDAARVCFVFEDDAQNEAVRSWLRFLADTAEALRDE